MNLTTSVAKRIQLIPLHLHDEFPDIPMIAIEHDVEERVRRLVASAHFDDFVPLLVHKAIRERLRAIN